MVDNVWSSGNKVLETFFGFFFRNDYITFSLISLFIVEQGNITILAFYQP